LPLIQLADLQKTLCKMGSLQEKFLSMCTRLAKEQFSSVFHCKSKVQKVIHVAGKSLMYFRDKSRRTYEKRGHFVSYLPVVSL